jgi:hypothetical protein
MLDANGSFINVRFIVFAITASDNEALMQAEVLRI